MTEIDIPNISQLIALRNAEVAVLKALLSAFIPKDILDHVSIVPHGDGSVIRVIPNHKLNLESYTLLSLAVPIDNPGSGCFESMKVQINNSEEKFTNRVRQYDLSRVGIEKLTNEIKKLL